MIHTYSHTYTQREGGREQERENKREKENMGGIIFLNAMMFTLRKHFIV